MGKDDFSLLLEYHQRTSENMKILTNEQRVTIVLYRMENARKTLGTTIYT